MRTIILVLCCVLLLNACTRSLPAVTSTPPGQPPPTQSAPEAPLSSTQAIFLPEMSKGFDNQTAPCEQHDASLAISASSPEVRVGENLTITLTLTNTGACGMLGLPKYTLATSADPAASLFNPASPAPVDHSLGIDPGDSDTATFTLQATAPGMAALAGSVSFEVHLGYPGPAYWANAASPPLTVRVNP